MSKLLASNLKLTYNNFIVILFVSLLVMILIAFLPPFNYWTFNPKNLDSSKFADYGQFISGLFGTIFAIGSAGLLYMTLVDQKRQFLESSFQNNFFSLLQNHRSILNSICDKVEGTSEDEESGADFFDVLAHRIAIDFKGEDEEPETGIISCNKSFTKQGKERIIEIYNHYFHIHQSSLGHYFRNLYHFVLFIDEGKVSDEIQKRHASILRAQLSNYEILLLAYNCLHHYGEKFKSLVEKYQLLQNLNFEIGLNNKYSKRIIDPSILIKEYHHLEASFDEQSLLFSTRENII